MPTYSLDTVSDTLRATRLSEYPANEARRGRRACDERSSGDGVQTRGEWMRFDENRAAVLFDKNGNSA